MRSRDLKGDVIGFVSKLILMNNLGLEDDQRSGFSPDLALFPAAIFLGCSAYQAHCLYPEGSCVF